MKHRSAILCQTAIVDQRSHNISLINVIDQLTLDGYRTLSKSKDQSKNKGVLVPISAHFVVYSHRSIPNQPESGRGQILIKGPNGKEIDRTPFEVDLTEYRRTRIIVHFGVFPCVGAGTYQLEVHYQDVDSEDWDVVDSVPLDVLVDAEAQTKPDTLT